MINCRLCGLWFVNAKTYQDHRDSDCIIYTKYKGKKRTVDNDLGMLSDYLNGKVDLQGNKII